ncbi:MAG: Gfo/Idh/MocA family oxidoreductase [Nitrospirae bacterium]|nr:Gfo/Idh/MocA family oxidoreductase [Nitrospirota bacterium]
MIRIGLIGYGEWGPNHFRHFSTLPGSRVVCVCDLNATRLESLRPTHPDLELVSDADAVLGRKDIDAVVIATPATTHFQLVKAALESGKDVLCEKPLTLKSSESDLLHEMAQRTKRILMVGHVFLFNAGIRRLKEYLDRHALGTLHYIYSSRLNLGPVRQDVDVIWDLASHDVSIMNYLLQAEPEEVSANSGFFLQRPISDVAFISLRYPKNVLVNLHVSWIDPVKLRQITVVGSSKMIVWNDLSPIEPIRIYDKGIVHEPRYSNFGEFHYLTREGDIQIPRIDLVEPLRAQDTAFLECVKQQKQPLSDGAFSVRVVRTLERISEALSTPHTFAPAPPARLQSAG